MATIIDGKARASVLRDAVAKAIEQTVRAYGVRPGLAVVLIGNDPASEVYVRNKRLQAIEAGLASSEHRLPAETSERAILELIAQLNSDRSVHGILVQLPLPRHIDADRVIEAIDPGKDVDGFHPVNVGRLSLGQPSLVPCTPYGVLLLLRDNLPKLAGLHAVVIGRSNIVGKPMVQLLLAEHCTVSVAHSRTRDLPGLTRTADIVVAAVGRPNFVRGEWLKPGACVVDVGINRIFNDEGNPRLAGDVAFHEAGVIAGAITPVPGGVGPMTIACLLRNTVIAACHAHDVPVPSFLDSTSPGGDN